MMQDFEAEVESIFRENISRLVPLITDDIIESIVDCTFMKLDSYLSQMEIDYSDIDYTKIKEDVKKEIREGLSGN